MDVNEQAQGIFTKYLDNVTEAVANNAGDEAFMREIEEAAKIKDDERKQWREEILTGAAKIMIRRGTPRWDNFTRLGDAIKTLAEKEHGKTEETLPNGFRPSGGLAPEETFPASTN